MPCNETSTQQECKFLPTYVFPHYGLPKKAISIVDLASRQLSKSVQSAIISIISHGYHPHIRTGQAKGLTIPGPVPYACTADSSQSWSSWFTVWPSIPILLANTVAENPPTTLFCATPHWHTTPYREHHCPPSSTHNAIDQDQEQQEAPSDTGKIYQRNKVQRSRHRSTIRL